MIRKVTVLLFVACCLGACSTFIPKRLHRSAIADIQGTWFSKGFGYIARFDREQLSLYTIAGNSCYLEDYSFKELAYDFPHLVISGNDQVEFGEKADDKHVVFKRIAAIPELCMPSPATDPLTIFDTFTDIMAEHYAFFDLHNIDWNSQAKKARATLSDESNDAMLAEAMFATLNGFKDSHLGVLAEVNGERRGESRRYLRHLDPVLKPQYEASERKLKYSTFRKQWIAAQRSAVAKALLGARMNSAADGKLVWGVVDGIGYLQVKQFLGYSRSEHIDAELSNFAKHTDRIMTELSDSHALILDVSLSRGGYSDLAFELASRFLPPAKDNTHQKVLVHRSYQYNVGKNSMREKYLRSSMKPGYSKPVIIIASGATTSAAEEFLMAMRELPQVTLVGQASNGSLSDVMDKQLPNGWLMVLSNEVFESADGEVFEGRGIPMDRTIQLFAADNPEQSYLDALRSELFAAQATFR